MLENKNTWNKTSPKASIIKIWNLFAEKFMGILNREPEQEMVILPESVRYALRYRDASFSPEDGLSLLEEKYWFLWVYICLKFYENDLSKLLWHLQNIVQGIKDDKSFAQYTEELRWDISLLSKKSIVLWTKSAQVSRGGFSHFCDGISTVFNTYKKEWVTILVAFSWLLWLKWIIQKMQSWESFYIFFPKNSPDKSFLSIVCEGNKISISLLNDQQRWSIFHDKSIVMIDDTQKTWSTFDKAEKKIREFCSPKNITKKALVVVQKT